MIRQVFIREFYETVEKAGKEREKVVAKRWERLIKKMCIR
jgi:hypothetical protein